MTVVVPSQSMSEVSELDREGLRSFICRVVSDPALRDVFAVDPAAAVEASGVVLSPVAVQAMVANHQAALDLTANMDDVLSSFFFFALA